MMANVNESLAVSIPHDHLASQNSPLTSPSLGMNKLSMHSRHSSLGTNPSMHRVARRKSVTSSATNLAAVAQAIKDGGEMQINLPSVQAPTAGGSALLVNRGGAVAFGGATQHSAAQSGMPSSLHGYPSPPPSLPTNGGAGPLGGIGSLPVGGFTFPRKVPLPSPTPTSSGISTVTSGSPPSSNSNGRRVRRASEGANALLGGQGSEETGRGAKGGVELKCDKCGKGYKHSSCLTKHLWEHTPEWSLTSKLLISKHQQVQLLEAASILVSMNPLGIDDVNGTPTPAISTASSGNSINDQSSAASSGSEDTPPPTDHHSSAASVTDMDLGSPLPTPRSSRVRPSKRHHTSNGVGGSRSSHHAGAPPLLVGSVPTHVSPGSSFPSHFVNRPHASRQRAGSFVNTTRTATAAAAAAAAADEESLAAAVELLSCSFGATPLGTTPVLLSPRNGMGMGSPTRPSNGLSSPAGFLEQLRLQARNNAAAVAANSTDVVMKIEEMEDEDGHGGVTSTTAYYNGRMGHRSGLPHSPANDDEMAVDDEDEEDDWGRRGSGSGIGGRMSTRAMMRRERRKSDEEEDGVFGKMEE